ncbi:hypothetical protein O6H91_11G024600 [Diphasiastrum complanatum]|uniref:Uncharacterized protein n=1 Tax=Diphasiastrum complanatum TaxID=34168 RepID=A0ACC2C747_DIPCM|nr:hypothetical protein O6H91_11G024600 [Diphasiastrum complanatum]
MAFISKMEEKKDWNSLIGVDGNQMPSIIYQEVKDCIDEDTMPMLNYWKKNQTLQFFISQSCMNNVTLFKKMSKYDLFWIFDGKTDSRRMLVQEDCCSRYGFMRCRVQAAICTKCRQIRYLSTGYFLSSLQQLMLPLSWLLARRVLDYFGLVQCPRQQILSVVVWFKISRILKF